MSFTSTANEPDKQTWYSRLWVKVVVEVLFTGLLWLVYFVATKVLPKKYRISNKTIKNFITVSFILFAVIGTVYLFSSLFAENEIYRALSQQIQKLTEL